MAGLRHARDGADCACPCEYQSETDYDGSNPTLLRGGDGSPCRTGSWNARRFLVWRRGSADGLLRLGRAGLLRLLRLLVLLLWLRLLSWLAL